MILSLPGLSGLWSFQRVVLECCCVARLFGRPESQLRRGDVWHCLNHNRANVRVVDVLSATVADLEKLTRIENGRH